MSDDQPGASGHPVASPGPLSLDIHQFLGFGEQRRSLRAEFRFDPASALVVTVTFVAPEGRIPWVMGRDLLDQGLSALGGLGDVQIWPVGPEGTRAVRLRLDQRAGTALFELPRPPLAQWLAATYQRVPAGTELRDADWDAWAAALHRSPEVRSD
ncbi:SsgA family sporulation/cell division regulator [Kitasatospora sp. NPDC057223]|uniref:SsgA family sporulation/cell division regulator n=1 Tax=Kitasatospora sp. NPDC057223 TaxID=3346055 RepID=UPI00362D0A44